MHILIELNHFAVRLKHHIVNPLYVNKIESKPKNLPNCNVLIAHSFSEEQKVNRWSKFTPALSKNSMNHIRSAEARGAS